MDEEEVYFWNAQYTFFAPAEDFDHFFKMKDCWYLGLKSDTQEELF